MFTVQPLFGISWGSDFLPWRGRVLFLIWLFFCVVLKTSYLTTFLSQLTVPNTTDAIKSFDDLVKSGLPVRARMHVRWAAHFVTLPLFQPVKDRTTFNVSGEPQRDRDDIAYLTNSLKKYEYLSMSYRFLPEIVDVLYVMPVLMTKHAFYD